MKIISHDLQMTSAYSFSQELLSTSFSELVTMPEELVQRNKEELDVQESSKPQETRPTRFYQPQTFLSIIDRLINSLQERMNSDVQGFEEQANTFRSSRMLSIHERYQESESFSFSTTGRIVTDSRELNIDIDFSMSRSFVMENKIDIYQTFDPLVININGEIPDLMQDKFSFDLDNDGEEDQISKLKEGSGFLALDKNEDGKINQGSELFGTILGNGFAELAEYDLDGNDWIDENDSIFDKLRIWFGNDGEEKELVGLGEAGVGAIFLQGIDSEFSYKTPENQTLGQLKHSGIFLHENTGLAGTIAQIDFTKETSASQTASASFDLGKGEGKKERKSPLGDLLQA